VLAIAWAVGIAASAAGLAGSYVLDVPTGAAMVTACALFLVLAGVAKALIFVRADQRRAHLRHTARAVLALALVFTLASGLWLIINPAADQPLAAVFESVTGLGPERFLSASEREIYESAARDRVRFQGEVDRLDARERAARSQGTPLSEEEIRRIASYQQSFNEMTRGERFVQDVLRAKARMRERWFVGLPATVISLVGLGLLLRPLWRHRPPLGNVEVQGPSPNSVVIPSE
jgi:zinc/manganese transport system permease protein